MKSAYAVARRPVTGRLLVLAAVGTLALTACGGNSSADEAGAPSGNSGGAGAVSSEVTGILTAAAKATAGDLPSQNVNVPSKLSVWHISCGEVAAGCADQTAGVKAAVGALAGKGWSFKLYDTKFDPSLYPVAIDQAVAAKADIITLGGIDCLGIKPKLEQAVAAGIIVVGLQAFDCDDKTQGGTKALFSGSVAFGPDDEALSASAERWGEYQAAWAIRHTAAKANVVLFKNSGSAIQAYVYDGFTKLLGSCSGCAVKDTIDFTNADLSPKLIQTTSSALLKNPDTNVVAMPLDPGASFASQAVKTAGKASSVSVLGTLGNAANLAEIKAGGPQQMTIGIDEVWVGWAAVDAAVRLAAKQAVVYSGMNTPLIDKANVPAGKKYAASVDYKANYLKLWAVG